MKIEIITLPFASDQGEFRTTSLDDFLVEKEVISVQEYFFQYQGKPYLTMVISYCPASVEQNDEKLYELLREWRNKKASEDGYAPYVIFTNQQLKKISCQKPSTLTALRSIQGVGKSRVEKYGAEILSLVHRGFSPGAIQESKEKKSQKKGKKEESADEKESP